MSVSAVVVGELAGVHWQLDRGYHEAGGSWALDCVSVGSYF
ncbi:MAG: hypothetical protein O7G85_01425 [Planctomycetota bacterium]|nr:hypothetical protein [Planctomycetota bacterium]